MKSGECVLSGKIGLYTARENQSRTPQDIKLESPDWPRGVHYVTRKARN